MRNQQGTPTKVELAWLAGFIEGEGSLALSAWNRLDNHASRNPKIAVSIKIYNTDAALISRCRDILKGIGVEPYMKEREQKPMLKHDGSKQYKSVDPMLTLTVSKLSSAQKALTCLTPYLFGDKRIRAEIMLEYLDKRLSRQKENSGNFRNLRYQDDEIALVKKFYTLTRPGQTKAFARRGETPQRVMSMAPE